MKKIEIVDYTGNRNLLALEKIGFLCSRRISAPAVLPCYDWAIEQRKKGRCVISGFHSLLEKDVFHFLSRGKQPLVIVMHKALPQVLGEQFRKMLDEGRLLIVTPFDSSVKKGSEETAHIRNKLVASLAQEVKVGYCAAGGNIERLCKETEVVRL